MFWMYGPEFTSEALFDLLHSPAELLFCLFNYHSPVPLLALLSGLRHSCRVDLFLLDHCEWQGLFFDLCFHKWILIPLTLHSVEDLAHAASQNA